MRLVNKSETVTLEAALHGVPTTPTIINQDDEKLIQINLDKYRQEISEIQSVYNACISEMRLEVTTRTSEQPALTQKLTTLQNNARDNREIMESKKSQLSDDPMGLPAG